MEKKEGREGERREEECARVRERFWVKFLSF